MATSIYLESFTAIKSANLVHASLNKVEVCTTQLQFKENQRFQHNCKNANAINIYKTMLRLLLGLALLCIYNGEQVTASPLTKALDAPQSKDPAVDIISGKEKRAPIITSESDPLESVDLFEGDLAIPTELIEEYYGTQNKHVS